MALSASDLEGFELVSERVPEKAGNVTVSTIPEGLVKLLTEHAPRALADKDYELILRVPVNFTRTDYPEKATPQQKVDTDKANAEAREAAEKKAVSILKQLALYAAAWGKGQDPKLYIHKVPNRKDMPSTHARLRVQLDEDVAKENRPGRR